MRVQVDCYPCILSQLSELAKQAVGGEEERHALVRRLLKLVLEADRETTPPEFAAMFHSVVTELSGIDDPFRDIKDRSTELGLALLPELRRTAEAHPRIPDAKPYRKKPASISPPQHSIQKPPRSHRPKPWQPYSTECGLGSNHMTTENAKREARASADQKYRPQQPHNIKQNTGSSRRTQTAYKISRTTRE